MNKLSLCKTVTASLLCAFSSAALAQEAAKPVAFRVASGEYVSMVPGGALKVNSKTITGRQIFQIVDANGGDLADGDEVKIKETGSGPNKPTFWQERSDGVIARIAKADAACVFKVKKGEKTIRFKTASGKFVAVADKSMTATDSEEKAAAFEVIENPTPQGTPAAASSPAAAVSPSAQPGDGL